MEIIKKVFSSAATSFKIADADQGIVEAVVAVMNNKDYGKDIIRLGAFKKSLTKKLPKVVYMHDWEKPLGRTLEAFELAPGDAKLPEKIRGLGGLFVRGQLNLEKQIARDVLSDLKAGVLDEFSIGFAIPEGGAKYNKNEDARELLELELLEWSPVLFGMNPETQLIAAKSASGKTDFTLAPRDKKWMATNALKRVKGWAGADEMPNVKIKQVHFWYDEDASDKYESYKLPFVDIVDGEPVAIPKAIFAAAGAISGARGGVDIPEDDLPGVKSRIKKYYKKMADEFGDDSIVVPWEKSLFTSEEKGEEVDNETPSLWKRTFTTLVEKVRTGIFQGLLAKWRVEQKAMFNDEMESRQPSFFELTDMLWCVYCRLNRLNRELRETGVAFDAEQEWVLSLGEFMMTMIEVFGPTLGADAEMIDNDFYYYSAANGDVKLRFKQHTGMIVGAMERLVKRGDALAPELEHWKARLADIAAKRQESDGRDLSDTHKGAMEALSQYSVKLRETSDRIESIVKVKPTEPVETEDQKEQRQRIERLKAARIRIAVSQV